MTVNVGTMQLPVPEDPDAVRTYLNGTHVSGGLWTALTRSSNHDHSGGTNGIQLTATSIPDGSITTAKLDPAVLGPYALVDGSKPFTGTVTMSADTLVRDTLRFGAKPAGVADATLSRTGAGALRVDTHLGVGVNPEAWRSDMRVIRVGAGLALQGYQTGGTVNSYIAQNSYADDTGNHAIVTDAGVRLGMLGGGYQFYTAPSVAAGALQTFTSRMALDQAGNLGVGVNPAAWGGIWKALQVGTGAALWSHDGTPSVFLTNNSRHDGSNFLALTANPAVKLWLHPSDGALYTETAPSVAAGATQTFTRRMALAPTGTLVLTPEAGQDALTIATMNASINSTAGAVLFKSATTTVAPYFDNTHYLGGPSNRWQVVFATTGTINTSSRDSKTGITPLDPLACYQAAKDVRWYEFAYLPPAYQEPEPPPEIAYDASDDNETKAEKKALRDEAEAQAREAHAKMLVETAPARHQRGFVFPTGAESKDEAGGTLPPVPDLFGLSDRESTTPQADLATLGCALQEVIRRLETLEGAAA